MTKSKAETRKIITYGIPLRHAWVEANLRETAFEGTKRADLDALLRFIESESDSIYTFEQEYGDETIIAGQLVASCPFCDAGNDQVLKGSNWVEFHACSYMDIPYPVSATEDVSLRSLDSEDDDGQEHLEVDLEIPFFAIDAGNPLDASSAYALDLSSVVDDLKAGYWPNLDYEWRSHLPARYGLFYGLYRCPCCDNAFAIAHRARCSMTESVLTHAAITCFIDASARVLQGAHDIAQRLAHCETVPILSIEARRKPGSLTLSAKSSEDLGQLTFDMDRGVTEIDGQSFIKDNRFIYLKFHGYRRSKVWIELFSMREVFEPLGHVLPSLPEGVELRFCPGKHTGSFKESRNLLLLMAANRFAGYPATFYNELASEDFGERLEMALPIGFALPREYAMLPKHYDRLRLPDDAVVKTMICEKPMLLLELLACDLNLVFEDVAALSRFLQNSRAATLMSLMNQNLYCQTVWRRLVEAQGDENVLRLIEGLSDEEVGKLSERFGKREMREVDVARLAELDGRELCAELDGLMQDQGCLRSAITSTGGTTRVKAR